MGTLNRTTQYYRLGYYLPMPKVTYLYQYLSNYQTHHNKTSATLISHKKKNNQSLFLPNYHALPVPLSMLLPTESSQQLNLIIRLLDMRNPASSHLTKAQQQKSGLKTHPTLMKFRPKRTTEEPSSTPHRKYQITLQVLIPTGQEQG